MEEQHGSGRESGAAGGRPDGGPDGAEAAEAGDARIAGELKALLQRTVQTLQETGARTEALGAFEARRRILGLRRDPVLADRGRVWRLGVLLLDAQGRLHTTGSVTRAVDPGRVTNQSERAELRRDDRRAAFQGTFERGDTVNFDTSEIALDIPALRAGEGMLALRGDTVLVRWSTLPGAGLTPLEPYLADRAALLVAPPP